MRTLGIDYGEKRIGVAVSDPLGVIAQGVAVIGTTGDHDRDVRELNKIIKKYDGVSEIVVGLPRTMKGEIGPQAAKVQEFIEMLRARFNLNITAWDERLTTAEAERMLISAGVSRGKRKKVIDKSAAAYILQGYLDSKKK